MNKPVIFLSHSKPNKQFVRKLAEKLKEDGIDAWLDELEIKIGESIHQKVNEAINKSDFFAIVLSQASVKSKWVQDELSGASSIEKYQKEGVFILPILIEECDVPPLLLDRRYANFKDDPDSAYHELVDSIYHHFKEKHPETDVSKIKTPEIDKDVIRNIIENKNKILDISPRQFEELVSSVFKNMGYEIQMTPVTKDGGYDIVASKHIATGLSPQKYIIECKRYSRPVGADVVRRLAGAQQISDADRAILVTTSSFTKEAKDEAKKFRLDLADYDMLLMWLMSAITHDNNYPFKEKKDESM